MGQSFHICLWPGPRGLIPPPYGQPNCKISVFFTPSLRFPLKVREEYRRRGLARVRERDKALGFILGMVDFTRLSYSTSSSLYRKFCHVYRQDFPMPSSLVSIYLYLYTNISKWLSILWSGDSHGCSLIHCPQHILQVRINHSKHCCPFLHAVIVILINPFHIGTIALPYATSTVGWNFPRMK